MTVTEEMARHVGTILPYNEARKLTRGFDHAIEAHHLIPNRYLKHFDSLSGSTVPAVVLLHDQHRTIERLIRASEGFLGHSPRSIREVSEVLERAYKNFPEYLGAIRGFL